MSYSYFSMWGLLILMGLAGVGGMVYRGELLSTFSAAYPSEPAKHDALRRCAAAEPAFSRFSDSDRRGCYKALLPSSAAASW